MSLLHLFWQHWHLTSVNVTFTSVLAAVAFRSCFEKRTRFGKIDMIVAVLLQCVLFNLVLSVSQHPVLIVVSYDAFRYNFFAKGLTPHMSSLRKEGTYAEYLENVFPTKTFPNHHSIATGIYPETHGVVDNLFYDPKLHKTVKISAEMYNYNENVLPIWVSKHIMFRYCIFHLENHHCVHKYIIILCLCIHNTDYFYSKYILGHNA